MDEQDMAARAARLAQVRADAMRTSAQLGGLHQEFISEFAALMTSMARAELQGSQAEYEQARDTLTKQVEGSMKVIRAASNRWRIAADDLAHFAVETYYWPDVTPEIRAGVEFLLTDKAGALPEMQGLYSRWEAQANIWPENLAQCKAAIAYTVPFLQADVTHIQEVNAEGWAVIQNNEGTSPA